MREGTEHSRRKQPQPKSSVLVSVTTTAPDRRREAPRDRACIVSFSKLVEKQKQLNIFIPPQPVHTKDKERMKREEKNMYVMCAVGS